MLFIIQASCHNELIKDRLLRTINEQTILDFLISRLKEDSEIDVVISTSDYAADDVIVSIAEKQGIECFRGEYDNVVGRLLSTASSMNAADFVRVYANSPLVDIVLAKELYKIHVENGYDYSYNEHLKGVIWGCGCDVFNTQALERLADSDLPANAVGSVGFYLRQNDDLFSVYKWSREKRRSDYKTSIETEKDIQVVSELVLNIDDISEKGIIDYLDKHMLTATYNRENPPRENGIEKLFFNTEKVSSILKHRLPDMTYPISVELTLTNRCNLNCVYCSDMDLRKRQGIQEEIDFETLKALFDDLASGGTKGVVLEGGGEPTLYSKFSDVVDYIRSVGLAVGLITNGTTKMDAALLKKFEWIRVSLDASSSQEYKALKGVDHFERVIDNIANYVKDCKTVGVGFVVTNNNISKIESLVIRLREIGVSYIQCRPVVDCPDMYPKDVDLYSLRYYDSKTFGVMTEGMVENSDSGNNECPCYAHSITSIISGDGSVYICGRLNIYDWLKPIGNIKEQSFRRIWYGIERQNQAERLADKEFCVKYCPQCRISKFNSMFSRLDKIKTTHFI